MKKFFNFGATLLLVLTMSGCVEINEDYDFSKLNMEEITIGDEFIAPIAKVTTSIADMELGDWADILPDGNVQKAAPLTEITFEQNYPISGGIDQSIIDMLTAQGQLYLLVDIENYTPVFFECYAHFLDAEGNVVNDPLGLLEIQAGTNESAAESRIEIEITADDLKSIANAASVSVYFKTNILEYIPDEDDVVVLTFKTKKSGGISLNGSDFIPF